MRYIDHLEAEILELQLENAKLKELLYGTAPEAEGGLEREVDMRPIGGFRPRAMIARNIKLKLARKARDERQEKENAKVG